MSHPSPRVPAGAAAEGFGGTFHQPEEAALEAALSDRTEVSPRTAAEAGADPDHLDSRVVEELTNRLPTAELVKIIKGALECGRNNLPFTESDLLRAVTFGTSALEARHPRR